MAFRLRLTRGFRAFTPQFAWIKSRKRKSLFRRALDGAAAVEFALVGPLFILLLMGIVTYGSYFLTAHTLQQIANDSARAAIAGLDDDERRELVEQSVTAGLAEQPFLKGLLIGMDVSRSDSMLTVRLTYDATRDVWTQTIVPSPSSTIVRAASIRLGGYS